GTDGFVVHPDPTPQTAPTPENPDPRSNGSGDRLGAAVSGAGDINNDGFDDVIIGAWSTENPNGLVNPAGVAYVIFGTDQGFDPSLTVTDLDGTNGFAIRNLTSSQSSGRLGFSVADAGDLNNDGIADIIIGERDSSDTVPRAGSAHVIFGAQGPWPALFDVQSLDGLNGFSLNGVQDGTGDAFDAGDRVGTSVDGAGDFNGDGIDDVIIGASGAKPLNSNRGAAYIVFGSNAAFPADFTIEDINGTNGIELFGGQGSRDRIGFSVAGVGDVTGDNLDDVLISTVPFNSGVFNSGGIDRDPVFLVFGTGETLTNGLDLRALDGEDGFWIVADGLDNLGFDVAPTGDLDGDGVGDL
ncbi:MAG: integrin alpha, partial [Planctomycetota bacterium]